jgi:single-stranded DNA-specific DHH superfamily exonuclease
MPDLVVILDKPYADQAFLDEIHVPVLWLDHHEPQRPGQTNVTYLNPRIHDDADNRSTTYWVWKSLGREQDLWLAAVGNISDWQVTEVAQQFSEQYPDLLAPVTSAPQALYDSKAFGELCRIVQFNLKGDSSDVRTAIKILSRVESPHELLEHTTPRAKLLWKRYEYVNKEYVKLLDAAHKSAGEGPLLFHVFARLEISLLSELSNQLIYEYPQKIVFLAREHNGDHKLSIRSVECDIAAAVKAAMADSGARGNAGGHQHACGGNIKSEDFPKFLASFKAHLGLT